MDCASFGNTAQVFIYGTTTQVQGLSSLNRQVKFAADTQ